MDTFNKAIQLVLVMLKGPTQPGPIQPDQIREKANLVLGMLEREPGTETLDREALIREIESRCNVWIGEGAALDAVEDHQIWLPDRRAEIDWCFWKRYQRFLEEERQWPEQTVIRLDELTDEVLQRLEDPQRDGRWDRRGMVVGQVQSGKTANYIGLVCKAADAGYKLIIVLAGMHNSLRSQTQLRVDEGFLGFDTQRNRAFASGNLRLGVGCLPGAPMLTVHSLTSSADDGDFRRTVANTIGVMFGGAEPVILVVKKNKSVLTNLLRWVLSVRPEVDPATGKSHVRGIPLLVIDDEADNASINTRRIPTDDQGRPLDDYDVTAINGLVRDLLDTFQQSAYVGYTATPFASIFIDPQGATDRHGEDIFPRSFIVNLPAPSNYTGPVQVFGLDADEGAGTEGSEGLPIVRLIDDHDLFIPEEHRRDKTYEPDALPPSLKTAIRCFIISTAARMARGQVRSHNSMLVHVTRYTAVQDVVGDLVAEELRRLRRRLEYGNGGGARLVDEMQVLWENSFVPTSEHVRHVVDDPLMREVGWAEVSQHLYDAAAKMQVRKINGQAQDALDFFEHKNGLCVIAIGGDKLSRGLTLEGLTVSYYLRTSRMYDTLMQMGRWFGYRPGYVDLCRVFTTQHLAEWYRHIALASEELRREFDYMASINRTPQDYGLRVRTHPGSLLVTAVNKMRSGTEMMVSYAGESCETTIFSKLSAAVQQNLQAVEEFVSGMSAPDRATSFANLVWRRVTAQDVLDLLSRIEIHRDCRKASKHLLREYIETQVAQGELTTWTVALVSQRGGQRFEIGGHEVGLTKRSPAGPEPHRYCLNKGRLLSPEDEALDLSKSEKAEALRRSPQTRSGRPPTRPSPEAIRSIRAQTNGLLLIYPLDPSAAGAGVPFMGFFLSFPQSATARPIGYRVNKVSEADWEAEFGDD